VLGQARRPPSSAGEGGGPAINRCMQIPDRIARRGHAAFAGWCPRAAWCCSLRSQLRSRSGNPALCAYDQGRSPLTPTSAQPCLPAFDLCRALAWWVCPALRCVPPVLWLLCTPSSCRRCASPVFRPGHLLVVVGGRGGACAIVILTPEAALAAASMS
jgi:hypothetical protein